MPKAKPDQVVVHRIELQDTEREILSGLSTALMFNRVADPIVKLLNDVTGTVTFLTLLAATGVGLGVSFVFAYDPDVIMDPIEQFLGQLQEAKEQAAALGGDLADAAARGPLWGTIDLAEQLFGINIPDFGGGFENPTTPRQYNDPTDLWMNNQGIPSSTEDLWRSAYSNWGSSR
ncbi:MAG TPA: hypothetical protein EYN66_15775 [Myxococcales bacterium]|nr:hypothetical protein [Myxococcales bacterium]